MAADTSKQTVSIVADPLELMKEVATMFGDEDRSRRFLDMRCSAVQACECIMFAASAALHSGGDQGDQARSIWTSAPQDAARLLWRFVCGQEVSLMTDAELMDLFMLAKKLGVDACKKACVSAMDAASKDEWPIKVCMTCADTKVHRNRLKELRAAGRFVDATIEVACDANDKTDIKSKQTQVFRVHRAVLAAASAYFAGLWAHDFSDSGGEVKVNIEADTRIVQLLISLVYGEEALVEAPEQLAKLMVLADRLQMPAVSTPLLVKLEATLKPNDAVRLLATSVRQPEPLKAAALAAMAADPQSLEALFTANKRCAAELLCSDAARLPVGFRERLELIFAGNPELGGPEVSALLTPASMVGILKANCRTGQYWFNVDAITEKVKWNKGECFKSPTFQFCGLRFRINFYPAGDAQAPGTCSMYLYLDASEKCSVEAQFLVDGASSSLKHEFECAGNIGFSELYAATRKYSKIGIHFLKLVVGGKNKVETAEATKVFIDKLVWWARQRSRETPSQPILEFHKTVTASPASPEDRFLLTQSVEIALTKFISSPLEALCNLPSTVSDIEVGSILNVVVSSWMKANAEELVKSSEWLSMDTDKMAVVLKLINGKDLSSRQTEVLYDGVVNWARNACASLAQALAHLEGAHTALFMVESDLSAQSTPMLISITQRLLDSYDHDALPVVEHILKERSRTSKNSGKSIGNSVDGDGTAKTNCNKRRQEDNDSPTLQAAASWAKAHCKRLKTSHVWSQVPPSSFAAVMGGEMLEDMKGLSQPLVDAWAEGAQLGSLLEAIQKLGPSFQPEIFQQLIAHLQRKTAALEEQNSALGGEGLREAWEVARAAQAEAAAAKEELKSLAAAVENCAAQAAAEKAAARVAQEKLSLAQSSRAALETEIFSAVKDALAKHASSSFGE